MIIRNIMLRYTKKLNRILPILILMAITMLASIPPVHAHSYKTPLLQEPLDENVALDHLNTILGREMDSNTLKMDAGEDSFHQDATIYLMNIQRNWSKWSPRFKENAGAYFLKKPRSFEPISAPKTLMRSNKTIRGVHLLPNWVETQNFSVEWGNSASGGDSGWDSNQILACSQGATCTGMPDVIDRWAEYFEEVWTSEVEGLGFSQPYGTETYLYDVYLANTMDNIQGNSDDITPFLNPGYLGFTVTYCDYELFNICKDNVTDAYSYIVVRGTIADTDNMKVTAAHEFFHAIQFTLPTIDDWFSAGNIWWIEATATWMEEVVYDDVNHYYSRVRRWLANPSLSLKSSGSQYAGHEYGDSLFVIFLTDVYLHDNDFVRYVWESQGAGIDAIDKVLSLRYYSDFESAFKEFAALNAVADKSSIWGGYEEGENYGSAAITNTHRDYPVSSTGILGEDAPDEFGTGYIKFLPPDNSNNRLQINFDGSDSINWAAQLVKVKNDGTGYDKDELHFTSPAKTGCLVVEEFGTTYGEVFLVSSILIEPTIAESMPYNYRAAMNSTCEDNSANASLIQADDAGDITDNEAGNPRCFIATAAFGSSKSPSVMILREFRDRYLIPYTFGKKFVDGYYAVSPSIADIIEKHPPMPFLVRVALFPAVGLAFLLIKTTLLQKIALVVTLFCFNIRHTH